MKKGLVFLVVTVAMLLAIPEGIAFANGECPRGEGWSTTDFPSDTNTIGISFSTKSADGSPIEKVCINGQIYEADGIIGNFGVTGLGTNEVWIVSNAQIYEMGSYRQPIPTETPVATATLVATSTPPTTATSTITPTPTTTATSIITATLIAIATPVPPTIVMPVTNPIAITIGMSLAIAAIVIIAVIAKNKKKH